MSELPIGAALRRARDWRRMTQLQVASRMGRPRTYISKVECARIVPTLATFLSYADALDIEAWRLLRWAQRQKREAA